MFRKVPKHITLILNETETQLLFELPSSIVLKNSEEGQRAIEDNNLYEYLTTGKGKQRRVAQIGVQTLPYILRTRHTEPLHYVSRDNSSFASNWEMYDTYNTKTNNKIETKPDHKLDEFKEEVRKKNELEENESFFDAALVIERLLANNVYNEKQKLFKGLETESKNNFYNYQLDLLWTFANDDTKSRCVTGISFNPLSEDMIAVGYGRYSTTDRIKTGVVMMWNIKNPKQPEREYYFKYSVTCLVFSKLYFNHLVIGFYNGDIKIIDVTKRDLMVVVENCTTSFEPSWDIISFVENEKEFFIASFGDGRICKYLIFEKQFRKIEIMRTKKVDGKLTGLKYLGIFEGHQIGCSRFTSASALCLHENEKTMFLAANTEGVIHKCSVNYCKEHKSMMKAHEGNIHSIKFSPFVENVFMTCGDDFQKCIWIEGIDEPLIVSKYIMEPVMDFEWSPTHSTIMVSLWGSKIVLWDIQRKIHYPQSQTISPSNSRNTICRFTKSGQCLLVGDENGNVHVFALSGLPFVPFFQKNLFLQSIEKLLVTNTKLSNRLKQLKW